MAHINLTSYSDTENLKRFTKKSFEEYCRMKLRGCEASVRFIRDIRRRMGESWSGRVCEPGTGNGKLLYALEREGLLSQGVGIEVSESRVAFAKRFGKYVDSSLVEIIHANMFDVKNLRKFDLIVMEDCFLQLLGPIAKDAESKALAWMRKVLKPAKGGQGGGMAALEFIEFSAMSHLASLCRMSPAFRIWEVFPEHDPFESVLSELSLDSEGDIVWNKTFVKRGSCEKSKGNEVVFRPYTRRRVKQLFEENGFTIVRFFASAHRDEMLGKCRVLVQRVD